MKAKNFWLLMTILIAILLVAVFNSSCYSPKKAEKAVSKALAYYPEQTIGKVRILAPCITSGRSFTTDSAAYKASIDSLYNTRGWYETLIRGIETLPPHPIQQDTLCPEMAKELILANQKYDWAEQYIIDLTDKLDRIKPVIHHTRDTVEDLSKVMAKDFELLEARKLYSAQTDELLKVKTERDKAKQSKGSLIWWLVGTGLLNIILGFLIFLLLKGKATKKLI